MLDKIIFKNKNFIHQIKDLSKFTGLSEYVIEKDIYVTHAINIVCNIQNEFYELVFQGGTSLAKAHRIIERMSEDCDFRIRFKKPGESLSKEFKRKALRIFRHELVNALKANGFSIDTNAIRVRNEGQFMSLRATYATQFTHIETIKPFIALEFFLGDVKIEPQTKAVTTLARQILGKKIDHLEFPVNSIAITETAAEKWVALTRRVANTQHRKHYRDATLVRHLYDLYKINEQGYLANRIYELIPQIVSDDCKIYKNHNNDYYQNPADEIKRAIEELNHSTIWRGHWDQFIETMVFSEQKPTYNAVLENINYITKNALSELERVS